MVKLNKIYTRTGDDGTTGLGNGERRLKSDLRIDAYGTVDEANATVGMVRIELTSATIGLDGMLSRVQNDLFDLGAELATPDDGLPKAYEPLKIVASQAERLERDIDLLNSELEPLNSFVLPGGGRVAAMLHLARTVSRRAERLMVALAAREPGQVGAPALIYMNRLSDLLFVASRWANDRGAGDVLWVPGQNR